MARTWEDNAQEFGALTRQGKDVRLALLAACSVVNRGRGRKSAVALLGDKVDATTFAARSGTTKDRVLRHLDAWNRFAPEAGLPPSTDLPPADALDLDITEKQAAQFDKVRLTAESPAAHYPLVIEAVRRKQERRQELGRRLAEEAPPGTDLKQVVAEIEAETGEQIDLIDLMLLRQRAGGGGAVTMPSTPEEAIEMLRVLSEESLEAEAYAAALREYIRVKEEE